MSSRLYRAIVGVGISLGTTVAACSGAIDTSGAQSDDAGGSPATRDKIDSPHVTETTVTATADAGRGDVAVSREDARTGDVQVVLDASSDVNVVDAPSDANILDAFCDAAWPTTKGNPSGPTCGPVVACAEAGPAPGCEAVLSPGVCNANGGLFPAWCVDGKWECSGGAIPQSECQCWGLDDGGKTCN